MRTITGVHPKVRTVTLVGEADATENQDIWVECRDGRRFAFTLFTLRNLASLMEGRLSFVSPGMLVVKDLSDEAIVEAVADAAELGIERFGVLQR